MAKTETADERAFRHKACDALGLPRQTRFVTCCVHGERGRVDDVYAMNNVCEEAGGGVQCLPDHPYCFAFCSPDLGGADA